jgi:hypothetical protein
MAEPELLEGRSAIVAFLQRQWACELDYRLVNESGGSRASGEPRGAGLAAVAVRRRGVTTFSHGAQGDAEGVTSFACCRTHLGRAHHDASSP